MQKCCPKLKNQIAHICEQPDLRCIKRHPTPEQPLLNGKRVVVYYWCKRINQKLL